MGSVRIPRYNQPFTPKGYTQQGIASRVEKAILQTLEEVQDPITQEIITVEQFQRRQQLRKQWPSL